LPETPGPAQLKPSPRAGIAGTNGISSQVHQHSAQLWASQFPGWSRWRAQFERRLFLFHGIGNQFDALTQSRPADPPPQAPSAPRENSVTSDYQLLSAYAALDQRDGIEPSSLGALSRSIPPNDAPQWILNLWPVGAAAWPTAASLRSFARGLGFSSFVTSTRLISDRALRQWPAATSKTS